ncbi:MAG: Crp/Fnr family transcriptional regulator [Dehalococcoidia bacterium]
MEPQAIPTPTVHATRQALARLLETAPLFERLPADVRERLVGDFRSRRYTRGQHIYQAGDPAGLVHLLGRGRVKVVQESEDGREVILQLVQPGAIFGAGGAWGIETYPSGAVAQDASIVWQLPAAIFETLIHQHNDLAVAVIHELGRRLYDANRRIRDLQTERVERRIARALLRIVTRTGVRTDLGIEVTPVSRQDLAELSGATLTTASRTLASWEERGVIVSGRERITVLKPHELVLLADELPGVMSRRL